LKPAERLLLRVLIGNEEARRELLEEVLSSGATEGTAAASLFRALHVMQASREPLDVMALQARLEEADRRLLEDIILGETTEPAGLEQGRAALRALKAAAWRARQRALHKQIEEAQKAGNVEEALRLLRAKQEMETQQPRTVWHARED
jgi:replicative DNA helicase